MLRKIAICIFCLVSVLFLFTEANAQDRIRIGVPPWPGVTVKSEIVAQMLDALGYDVVQLEVGPAIIYQGLPTGDIDLYLGAWMPGQKPMLDPILEKGGLAIAGTNLDEALISLCVPDDAWEAGVKTVGDLDQYADRFDHTIYNIEPGSSMHSAVEAMIKTDVAGLGDWKQVAGTTPVMLAQAQSRMRNGKWVAFGCWKPHWMDVKMNIRYLEGVPGTEGLVNKSSVLSVTAPDFSRRFPEAEKFISQIYVPAKVQSGWIRDFGYEKRDPTAVARQWLIHNKAVWSPWLKGVLSPDGRDAVVVVSKALQ